MPKILKDSTTKFAVNERLLYQPVWAQNRKNPRAYGRVVHFAYYTDDSQRVVVNLDGLFYKVNVRELSPVPADWADTNEGTLFYLLQRNEDLQKEVNALAVVCISIAVIILTVLIIRGV